LHGTDVDDLAGAAGELMPGDLASDQEGTGQVGGENPVPVGQPDVQQCTVDDLIGPVVFFASSASIYVNGQVLFIDGGMTAVV
jgi:gluconate 5-dehydrogenase